jgi:hypothetical protein
MAELFGVTHLMVLKYSEYKTIRIIIQGKWIHVGNCLKYGDFLFYSVYIFTLLLYMLNKKYLFTNK